MTVKSLRDIVLPGLFDAPLLDVPQPDGHPDKYQHAIAPATLETSQAAAASTRATRGKQREAVYRHVVACGWTGATDDDIAEALGIQAHSVPTRRKELQDEGRIKVKADSVGTVCHRKTRAGRQAVVWIACNDSMTGV